MVVKINLNKAQERQLLNTILSTVTLALGSWLVLDYFRNIIDMILAEFPKEAFLILGIILIVIGTVYTKVIVSKFMGKW